jgi:hypothetical protein
MAWMTVPRRRRSQLHAKFHVLGLEMVQYSNANMLQCPYSVLTLCWWPQYFQEGWGKSSEWVKWHGWKYQAVQDPTYMTNSTFWGWRWSYSNANVLQCPYSALTLCGWPQYYPKWVREDWVGEMAWMTVPSHSKKRYEWVKWHGWQCQAVQDPSYMPNSKFWGWWWCRIAMRMCYSALTLCGWPQYYPRWVGEEFWVGKIAWMTVTSLPRSHLYAQFHVLGLEVELYSEIPITCLIPCFGTGGGTWVGEMAWMTVPSRSRSHLHA